MPPPLDRPSPYQHPYQSIPHINSCPRVSPCSVGKVFDRRRCKCVCITQVSQCPGSTIYNSNICQCECPIQPVCNQFQKVNLYYCRCDPVGIYGPGGLLPTICPPSSSRFCSPGQIFNPTTCQCECSRFAAQRCTSHQRLDPVTCECVCTHKSAASCTSLQRLDSVTCECVCNRRHAARCTSLQRFNPDTCECECSRRRCRFPQVLNPKTCQCSCRGHTALTCTGLQRFNSRICQCECIQVYVTTQFQIPGSVQQAQFPSFFIPQLSQFRGKRSSHKARKLKKLSVNEVEKVQGPSKNSDLKIREKRRSRSRTRPGTGRIFFFPPTSGFVSQPPTITTQRQLISAPCPAGTFLDSRRCECL